MRRSSTAWRVGLVMIACVTGLSACRDNGLDGKNLPLEEAQNRVHRYPVYERSGDSPALAMGGRHWIRTQTEVTIAPHVLVPVGTVEGTQLFARRGEEAPYSSLWARVSEDRWTPYRQLN